MGDKKDLGKKIQESNGKLGKEMLHQLKSDKLKQLKGKDIINK